MKVLLVGSQHGNELLGDKLIDYIRQHKPDLEKYVEFYLANPKAHAVKKRYIEEDMNRSYKSKRTTYEAAQAQKLVDKITQEKYDLVLDLHTTNAVMDTCFIGAPHMSKNIRDFVNRSTINKVVLMDIDSMARSLACAVENCIAIEIISSQITKQFLEELTNTLYSFCSQQPATSNKEKQIYYVTDYILKSNHTEQQIKSMKNFEHYNDEFYPILVGGKSYKKDKPYVGFAATRCSVEAL